MKSRQGSVSWLSLALIAFLAVAADAKLARIWEPVPVGRLVQNVARYVQEHPNDAQGFYTLGRIHSIAYGQKTKPVDAIVRDPQTNAPLNLPGFPSYMSVAGPRQKPDIDLDKPIAGHLFGAIDNYKRATQLAPKEPLYFLGLGWMLEQGAQFATQLGAPPGWPGGPVSVETWRQQSLAAYRSAYTLASAPDNKRSSVNLSHGDDAVSVEAGEGILRMFGKRTLSPIERREADAIRAHIKVMNAKPRFMTPIVFPLRGSASLGELLTGKTARFDLGGECRVERWPWVGPETGILVWDPDRTSRITSGRQLFGSRTWQGIWRNGYEPLAALDDNADGWLTGKELAGIAVWSDRNGNGRSDPGEVIPVEDSGIVAIAVRPSGIRDGVPAHDAGIRMHDGTLLPTFDWTPETLTDKPRDMDVKQVFWE